MLKKSIIILVIFLFLFHSIGCSTFWSVQPDKYDEIEKGQVVRITMCDGKELVLIDVQNQDLMISGYYFIDEVKVGAKVEVSKREIVKLEVEKYNPSLTTCAVALIIAGFVGVGAIIYGFATIRK